MPRATRDGARVDGSSGDMSHSWTRQQEQTLRQIREAEREGREEAFRVAALTPTREEERSAAFALGWQNVLRAAVVVAVFFSGRLPLWLVLCVALVIGAWWTWDAVERPGWYRRGQ